MSNDKIVFCDTGFVIRLLDRTSELHENALGYLRYFLENDYVIRMSTIAVAEFCVKDRIEHLPLKQILLSPFNAYHASKTGECARILYEAKTKGVVEVDARILIQNDVKLLVQAECERAGDRCKLFPPFDRYKQGAMHAGAVRLQYAGAALHLFGLRLPRHPFS